MKDNEKRPAPPPPPHDDHHDYKKKKKKHGHAGIIILLVLIIIILAALLWFFRDGLGFGKGNGDDSGNSGSGNSQSSSSDTSSDFVSDITEIRIEQNDIYFGDKKCDSTDALKDKITAAGSGKKYRLEHKTAIEETYNEVKKVLVELRDALDLEIDLNE